MKDPQKDDQEPKKVFFITSNQSKLDKYITYETPRNKGLINLKAGDSDAVFRDQRNHKREIFSLYINSIEISPKDLKKEDQDPKSRIFTGLVNLKYNKNTFPGKFKFRHSKNNFIYDFEFKEYYGWGKTYYPPPSIMISKLDQLKFYTRYMKEVLKKKQKDQIYKDLITD